MKVLRMLAITISLSFLAINSSTAQSMFDCQSFTRPTQRLACYDKLSPPISKQAISSSQKNEKSSRDPYAAANARIKRLFQPICRNC